MAQTWNAAEYASNGRFVADLAGEIFEWLDPKPLERILDLGCGDGALTERIAASGAIVTGVDRSPDMVKAAQARGLKVQVQDGEHLPFRFEFDAVFSNAALHWMLNQDAVLEGVRGALRPGGRFVAELGGHGNIAAIRTALRAVTAQFGFDAEDAGSNVFFTTTEYEELLQRHGFVVERIELFPRPTLLPTGLRAWIETFRRSLLDQLSLQQQGQVLDRAEDLLRPILCDRNGNWYGDYVRLRFRAILR